MHYGADNAAFQSKKSCSNDFLLGFHERNASGLKRIQLDFHYFSKNTLMTFATVFDLK